MKIKVAAIQMNCKLGDVDANLEKAEGLLKEAVEKRRRMGNLSRTVQYGLLDPKAGR